MPYDSHLSRSNAVMMTNSQLPMNEHRNLSEQAQIEEKHSLSALNQFISMLGIENSIIHLCLI